MGEHLELTGDLGDGLRLKKPLRYRLKSGKDFFGPYWVAEDGTFWFHALAETRDMAVAHLREVLAREYRWAKARPKSCEGADTSKWLGQLCEYIDEIAP